MVTEFSDFLNTLNDPNSITAQLEDCKIDESQAQSLVTALKSNSNLQKLNLMWNKIGDSGAKYLSDALKSNTSLQVLGLRGNIIGDYGAKYLSDALKSNTNLQVFGLRGNIIGEGGAKYLGDALKSNSTLQRLNLAYNIIGENGAKQLSDGLKFNLCLQELDLWGNNVGESGATHLSDALKSNRNLQILELRNNNIGDNGANYLSGALKCNSSLQILDLQDNNIGDNGANYLSDALKFNSGLRILDLEYNNISENGKKKLIEALKSNYTLIQLHGISDTELSNYLFRNKKLAQWLTPLYEAISKGTILDGEKIESILIFLEKTLPELHDLPKSSYPAEAYRLLTALGHMSVFSNASQANAPQCLFPSFNNQALQNLADKALGILKEEMQKKAIITEDKSNELKEQISRGINNFLDWLSSQNSGLQQRVTDKENPVEEPTKGFAP